MSSVSLPFGLLTPSPPAWSSFGISALEFGLTSQGKELVHPTLAQTPFALCSILASGDGQQLTTCVESEILHLKSDLISL